MHRAGRGAAGGSRFRTAVHADSKYTIYSSRDGNGTGKYSNSKYGNLPTPLSPPPSPKPISFPPYVLTPPSTLRPTPILHPARSCRQPSRSRSRGDRAEQQLRSMEMDGLDEVYLLQRFLPTPQEAVG